MCRDNRRGNLADEQRRTGFIAVVAFITHLKHLCDHCFEIDLTVNLQGLFNDWIQCVLEPFQAGNDLVAERAEAKNLAKPLVEGAVGIVAVCFIDNLPNRHGICNDTGHRADCVMMMAGIEGDLPGSRQLFGLLFIGGKPFVNQAADDRAAHRAAHFVPCDRRTGMQDGFLGHTGDVLAGGSHTDKRRLCAEDAFKSFSVSLIDLFAKRHCKFLPFMFECML